MSRTSCCSPSSTDVDHAGRVDEVCAPDCSRSGSSAEAAPRRQGDRCVERARARRARGSRRRFDGPTGRRRPRTGRVLARPAFRRQRPARRGSRDGSTSGRLPRRLREHDAWFLELHVATGEPRWLHEANRLARLAIELFADDEHGGFFLSPADGERLVARTKELDDHPLLPATRCSRTCCSGSRGSMATTSSSAMASPCFASCGLRSSAPRPRSGGRSARSTSGSVLRASLRSSERSTPRSPAPRSGRGSRPPWSRSVRTRTSAARRENACRRGACRLPLRAIRVPGSGHGSRAAVTPCRMS